MKSEKYFKGVVRYAVCNINIDRDTTVDNKAIKLISLTCGGFVHMVIYALNWCHRCCPIHADAVEECYSFYLVD